MTFDEWFAANREELDDDFYVDDFRKAWNAATEVERERCVGACRAAFECRGYHDTPRDTINSCIGKIVGDDPAILKEYEIE